MSKREKVTVKISVPRVSTRTQEDDIYWISEVFEVSKRRAQKLVCRLHSNKYESGRIHAEMNISYHQLGNYIVKRTTDNLTMYWGFPRIENVIIEDKEEQYIEQPVELR